MATRAARNDTVLNKGNYERKFNTQENLKVETGAKLVTEEESDLNFPFDYSSKTDSYIQLPRDWENYFLGEDHVRFTGIQIKPEYVNRIFPNSLNRYSIFNTDYASI